MEQGFLMDSNVVIDYFGNNLTGNTVSFIDNLPAVISDWNNSINNASQTSSGSSLYST